MHLNNNLLKLHFTIFIWGFTAILGQLISVQALPLVWYRMVLAAVSLWVFLKYKKRVLAMPSKDLFQLLGIGLLVAAHWVCFYHSIKISTVSVALVCLSSQTLFTGILEPLFNKTKISKLDIFIGVLIIIGIAMIFHFEGGYTMGILVGLAAALLASVFIIFNSSQVKRHLPVVISYYEMLGGFAGISVFALLSGAFSDLSAFKLSSSDMVYMLLLSIVCTAFAYVLGVAVMKELSAYTVALTTNLEPVYGILLALLFFNEDQKMTAGFYGGAFIVIAAIFLHPLLKKQLGKRKFRYKSELPT